MVVFGEQKEGNIKLQLEMFYAHRDPSARPSSLLTHTFLAMRDCGGGTRPPPLHVFRPTEGPASYPPSQGWSLQPPCPQCRGRPNTTPRARGEPGNEQKPGLADQTLVKGC